MEANKKLELLALFETISKKLEEFKDPPALSSRDLPQIDNLEEYLKKHYGQIIILNLQDKRVLAIYPDATVLNNKYDVEIHYSTLCNLEKLFKIFKAKELLIRDL